MNAASVFQHPMANLGDDIAGAIVGGFQAYRGAVKDNHEALAAEALKRIAGGDYRGAYEVGRQAQDMFNAMHGTNFQGPRLINTPTTPDLAAPQGPTPSGAPLAAPPDPAGEPRPDFSNAANQRAISVFVGAPAPEIKAFGPDQSLYQMDRTGHATFLGRTEGKNTPHVVGQGARLVDDHGNVIAQGAPRVFAPQAPHYVPSYNADGTVTYVPASPGLTVGGKPRPDKVQTDKQLVDTAKAMWGHPYPVEERDRHNRPTGFAKGADHVPMAQAIQAWEDGWRTIYDQLKSQQGAAPARAGNVFQPQPSGGGSPTRQNPFVRPAGADVPHDYNDVALLPEVEQAVQAGLQRFPGLVITSRARSDARNQAAGGAPDSSHKHRVGFDLVPPRGQDAAVRAFYEGLGYRVLGPGDPGGEAGHLHVDMRSLIRQRQSAAPDMSNRLSAFYERHGITPGAADALA